jgi:hypothetical protein
MLKITPIQVLPINREGLQTSLTKYKFKKTFLRLERANLSDTTADSINEQLDCM